MVEQNNNLTKQRMLYFLRIFTGNINKVTVQDRLGLSVTRISKVMREEDDVRCTHTKSKMYEMK